MPTFEFAAVRGIQGGRSYYVASVPFSILARLLAIDTGNTLDRSQRDVDERRATAVAKYIGENPHSFVIPALTGIIQAENLQFIEHKSGSFVGTIQVPMDAEIKLFDGQHRAVGIMKAVKDAKGVPPSEVPVQLFTDMTLEARKQAFADINSNAKAVSASLNQAYNLRDESTQRIAALAEMSPFSELIEYQKNAVSGKSRKMFALKTLIEATQYLLNIRKRDMPASSQIDMAARFWDMVSYPAGWNSYFTNPAFTSETGRNELITFHGVGLLALGRLGGMLISAGYGRDDDMKRAIGYLHDISFKRLSNEWTDICVTPELNMISNVDAQKKTAQRLFDFIRMKDAARSEMPQQQTSDEAERPVTNLPAEETSTVTPDDAVEFAVLIDQGDSAVSTMLPLMFGMKDFFSVDEFDQAEKYLADKEDDEDVLPVGNSDWYNPFHAAVSELIAFQVESSIIKNCISQAIVKLEAQGRISYLEIKAITKGHIDGDRSKTAFDLDAFKKTHAEKGGAV